MQAYPKCAPSMWKYIVISLSVMVGMLAPVVSGSAQSEYPFFNEERTFYGGLVLGGNLAQIDGDGFAGYRKIGLNAGAIVYWKFGEKVGSTLEILYSQKGSRGVSGVNSPYSGSSFAKYAINLNYIELPVLLQYFMSERYHVGIGASYNALINTEEYFKMPEKVTFPETTFPFNKYSVDLVLSGNMMIWQGLMINARYQYSLTPVRQAWNVPPGFNGVSLGSGHQINNMLAIRLIYLF